MGSPVFNEVDILDQQAFQAWLEAKMEGRFYHTHLQVITRKGYDEGWVSKGYCTARDLAVMDGICPSPLSLFTR